MRKQSTPESPTSSNSSRRRGTLLASGLLAALTLAGAGGLTAVALSAPGDEGPVRSVQVASSGHDGSSALGDVTLDQLSEELAKNDLYLEVHPGEFDTGTSEDGAASDSEESADSDDSEQSSDPFEGMSDAEIDALSDEEFFAILDESGVDYDEFFDELDELGDEADYSDDQAPIAEFSIRGDVIETGDASPEVAQQARAIWERFITLIPADQRQMVVSFELLDEQYQGAHVYPTDADPSKWVLGVGVGLDEYLDATLVHEFGHLLTLQAQEVPPSDASGGCSTYFTGEGCALSGSTMAGFVQRFWPQDLLDEHAQAMDSRDQEAMYEFYLKYQDHFVTDYATTNPAEDLAETFTEFVLRDRPTGESVADQKIQYLWSDSSMVALRDQIRVNL